MPQRPTELRELGFVGPFGGIQSECSLVQIEGDGFADALNVVFYDGNFQPRPGLSQLLQPTSSTIQAIFDFFDAKGNRHVGVISGGSLWELVDGTSWTQVTGTITDTSSLFSWTVVGGQLLFSQGADPVQMWDGIATTFANVSPGNAVPAFHLGELNTHLIACPTVEGGVFAPQRIRWTTSGQPNNWTGYDSGISDLFNDLGPINGWRKIYQQGYVFQQWGIVQQVPTGNASEPFIFSPLSSKQKGLYFPWTLSGTGEFAIYGGKDNVYLFNGSSSEPIGDMPLRGRSWIGARDLILQDLYAESSANLAYGFFLPSTGAHEYETYWLLIPGQSTWVYNMKEANWTRFIWTATVQSQTSVMSCVQDVRGVEIKDLIGTIAAQIGMIKDLSGSSALGDVATIGFANGQVAIFDFSNVPDSPWSLTTGTLAFGDTRHSKDIRRIRFVIEADTDVSLTVTATNEQGQSETESYAVLAAAGTQYQVVPFHMPGFYTTVVFSGPPGQIFRVSEIAIGYGMGKEAASQ